MSWRFASEYPKSITENVELATVVLDNRKQIVNSPTLSGFEKFNTTPSPRSSPTFTPFWLTTTPCELSNKDLMKIQKWNERKKNLRMTSPLEWDRRRNIRGTEPILMERNWEDWFWKWKEFKMLNLVNDGNIYKYTTTCDGILQKDNLSRRILVSKEKWVFLGCERKKWFKMPSYFNSPCCTLANRWISHKHFFFSWWRHITFRSFFKYSKITNILSKYKWQEFKLPPSPTQSHTRDDNGYVIVCDSQIISDFNW